jgi:hypothetical protein
VNERQCKECGDDLAYSARLKLWGCMACATPATPMERIRALNNELRRLQRELKDIRIAVATAHGNLAAIDTRIEAAIRGTP